MQFYAIHIPRATVRITFHIPIAASISIGISGYRSISISINIDLDRYRYRYPDIPIDIGYQYRSISINIDGTYRSRESKPSIAPSIAAPAREDSVTSRTHHDDDFDDDVRDDGDAAADDDDDAKAPRCAPIGERQGTPARAMRRWNDGVDFDCARPDRGLRVGRSLARVVRCHRRDVR